MKISKAEYMLLVVAAAQKAAGAGKTPSAAQISAAQSNVRAALARRGAVVAGDASHVDGIFDWAKKKIREEKQEQEKTSKLPFGHPALAANERERERGRGGMAGWTSGWSWNRVKSIAKSAAPYALPLIPGAIAAPFIMKAMAAKKSRDEATKRAVLARKQAEAQAQPESQPEPQAEEQPASEQENAQHVLGEGMFQAFDQDLQEVMTHSGGAEANAMRRFGGGIRRKRVAVSGMPQPMYRAAVWQRAAKLAHGKPPGPREIFVAQRSVDKDLHRRGVSISIPGARPGRVTRG